MIRRIIIVISLCVMVGIGYAQEEFVFNDTGAFFSLTRKAQPKEELPTNVSVINSEMIEKMNARTLGEVLQAGAGINISKYGSLGAQSTIILRGSQKEQVLVLVDGRPVNDITIGGVDYSDINSNTIDRVEIIRGAASSIYGANALAGVVNVITKKAVDYQPEMECYITAGSYGEQTATVNFAKKQENINYSLIASKDQAEGFRQNSDYDKTGVDANVGVTAGAFSGLSVKAGYSARIVGVPGTNTTAIDQWDNTAETLTSDPNAQQNDDKNYIHLTYEKEMGDNAGLTVSLYNNNDIREYQSPVSFVHSHITKKALGFGAQLNMTEDSVAGVEIKQDHATRINKNNSDSIDYDPVITWTSAYLQKVFKDPKRMTDTIISVRYDNHILFGGQLSPQMTVVKDAGDGWVTSFNVGTGYRAPTIEDLYTPYEYWPAFGAWPASSTQGNAALTPETSINFDMGFGKSFANGKGNGKVTFFRQEINNMIEWSIVNNDPTYTDWRPSNVAKAFHTGVELEVTRKVSDALNYFVNFTYLDSKGKGAFDTAFVPLQYRPQNETDAGITYAFPSKTTLTCSIKSVGKQLNDQGVDMDPYSLINVRVDQKINAISLFILAENVGNTRYYMRRGYPLPGATFQGGVSIYF